MIRPRHDGLFEVQRPSPHVNVEQSDWYLRENWALYGIGTLTILVRLGVRIRMVGLGGLQGDDYLAVLVILFYTYSSVVPEITYYTGGNLDVEPNQVSSFSQSDVDILVYGSKLEFSKWYSYVGVIWTLKFMLLFFYKRLTHVFKIKTLTALFWFCGLSWIAVIMTITFSCRPIHLNWQIDPFPGSHCTFRAQNFWAMLALNLSTDAAILVIPVPILWGLRVSPARRIGVSVLLLSGVFIMATSIVRAIMIVLGGPSAININRWGMREMFVGILAVNASALAPMVRKSFWRRWRGGSGDGGGGGGMWRERGIMEVKDDETGSMEHDAMSPSSGITMMSGIGVGTGDSGDVESQIQGRYERMGMRNGSVSSAVQLGLGDGQEGRRCVQCNKQNSQRCIHASEDV